MTTYTPTYDHIVVVVEENRTYANIIGNSEAAYINSLASGGALLANYHAVTHPSEPNYFALYAGSTFGIQDDGDHTEQGPTLESILQANGESFLGYVDAGSPRKHNPWESFPEAFSVERSFGSFPLNDFSQLPDVSFVMPNLNDDMHDGSVVQADQWLEANLDSYAQWARTHNSLFVVVWDEDDSSGSNQVPAILYGAHVNTGTYGASYTHYDLLNTLLSAFHLSAPNEAANAHGIEDGIFKPLPANDFNCNYTSDVLFRNAATGDIWFEAISNGAFAGWTQISGSDAHYSVVGVGDLMGIGTSDIVFRNHSTGDTWLEAISNGAFNGWHQIGGSDTHYSVVGVGDFDGNSTDDILFRNNSTGDTWFESISNGAFTGWHQIGASDTNFSAAGVGDFFGNGTNDILFTNNSTGDTWFGVISNGAFSGWHQIGGSDTHYSVVGVGDFFGNGIDDILFRDNSTGDTWFEAISNGAFNGWHQIGGSDTNYSIVAIGDYFGNGTSDILFRNNSTGDMWSEAISNGSFAGWDHVGGSNTSYAVKA
jgi:hypothetical protein